MENCEILLTEAARENISETLDTLLSAAQDIASAQEQDFERIKEKKWYNRLWEIITFSKDNQKIQARGVGNLAKLNEITLKAIVLVSKISQENSALICETLNEIKASQQDIEDLYNNQNIIIETIIAIRRGFSFKKEYNEFSPDERCVIFEILLKYASTNNANEYTQELIESLSNNSPRMEIGKEIKYSDIENTLNKISCEKLYELLQIYSLLSNDTFADEEHEIFYNIALSPNTKKAICEKVYKDIKVFGKSKYVKTLYAVDENDSFVKDTDIEWQLLENIIEENHQEETDHEIEVLNIDNMVHIAPGETKSYEYKEIHICSLIHCEGVIEFNNCVITYNEKSGANEITLEKGAKICATNCTFIGKDVDKNFFITMSDDCTADFCKCIFYNCSYFFQANKTNQAITICECEIYNSLNFVKFSSENFELSNAIIKIDEKLSWDKKDYLSKYVFDVSSKKIAQIHNVTAVNINDNMDWNCIKTTGDVKNSSFYGLIGTAVMAKNIENCFFENCQGSNWTIALSSGFLSDSSQSFVKSCVFDNCTKVIEDSVITNTSKITQCRFENCFDQLINIIYPHEAKIAYCEFVNYKNNIIDKWQGNELSDPVAGIRLSIGKTKTCVVKKCIFDGIDINEGFLISPHTLENLSGHTAKIIDCDFRNWKTKRTSGKIIKSYSHYYGLFNKRHNQLAIKIENCHGLEQKWQNAYTLEINSDAKTQIVGSLIGTAAATLIGGLILGSAIAITNNIVKINQNKKKENEISTQAKNE